MEYYSRGVNMGCSINIIRRVNPTCEVKYVDVTESEELKRARRAIIQHIAEQELLKELEE